MNSGITYARGFKASGISCGIKKNNKKDLALIHSDSPAIAAGLFTTNKIKSASILINLKHLKKPNIRAILINSGNANACTGKKGIQDGNAVLHSLAKSLSLKEKEILLASTGRIGIFLPVSKIKKAIPDLIAHLSEENNTASEAILTTDTKVKEVSIATGIFGQGKREVRLGGMAKGAGMICPNLATMLAFFTTDAVIEPTALREALMVAVRNSFNLITVDNDESTNDTVIILANGKAKNKKIKKGTENFKKFSSALNKISLLLAKMIVADGEGAKKIIAVKVKGAWCKKDANRIAKMVAGSNLVKAAIGGSSPNWGRIMSALGSARAKLKANLVDLSINGILVFSRGEKQKYQEKKLKDSLNKKEVEIEVNLHSGSFQALAFGCDLTEEYVKINKV